MHNFFVEMLLGLLRFLLIIAFGLGMAALWVTGFIYSFHLYAKGVQAVPDGMGLVGVFIISLMTVILVVFCISMVVGLYSTSKATFEMLE